MEHEFKTILDYDECPVRHVVIEEKKEEYSLYLSYKKDPALNQRPGLPPIMNVGI